MNQSWLAMLAYPWMLLLIPLALFLPFLRSDSQRIPRLPSASLFSDIPKSLRQRLRLPILYALLCTSICSLAIGAARPQTIIGYTQDKKRNLILALDVSPSMEAPDFMDGMTRVSRLEGVKQVVADFIAQRFHDRIGLVVFGGRSYLQSPLTTDHAFLTELVRALTPGLAGDGTAIGDGLGTALKRIKDLPAESKAVVLLTDGVNNAGTVDPINAAEIAQKMGVKVHTIGIGRESSDEISIQGFRIQTGSSEYDASTLKMIADKTGGVYFNAGSTTSLKEVYDQIDELAETEADDLRTVIVEEHYSLWGLIALATLSLYAFLNCTILSRI